jgi:hypothetical protein
MAIKQLRFAEKKRTANTAEGYPHETWPPGFEPVAIYPLNFRRVVLKNSSRDSIKKTIICVQTSMDSKIFGEL